MAISLSDTVYRETGNRLLPIRIYKSIRGDFLIGALTTTSATIASVAPSYFCMEGSVRSIIEASKAHKPFERLRPLGDVGGWISITLFSTLAWRGFIEQLVTEVEYQDLKTICLKWIDKNQDQENLGFNQFYLEFNDILDAMGSRCLFSKRLILRRLTALDVFQQKGLITKDDDLAALDSKLATVYQKINTKLAIKTSLKRYFHRVYEGLKSEGSKGCISLTMSSVYGLVIPFIFIANSALSLAGEVGLGNQLFVNRTDLSDVGHFGEWPVNIVESLAVGCLYHSWHIVAEGDFNITKSIYGKEITKLKKDPTLHNRLCEIANAELSEKAAQCRALKTGYTFTLL